MRIDMLILIEPLDARLKSILGDDGISDSRIERVDVNSHIRIDLREDEGEIEAALAGKLPALVEFEDIQGLTHCHTVYSDGKNSVAEMAFLQHERGRTLANQPEESARRLSSES